MKLTRLGYNSFNLEGLTLDDLKVIKYGVYAHIEYNHEAKKICIYLDNCGIDMECRPDEVNAIKSGE